MNPEFSRGLKFVGDYYLALKCTKQKARFVLNGARRGPQSPAVIADFGRQGRDAGIA
jgi:hypothetical protein